MSFYAILDGHGGVKAADYVAGQLFANVVNKLKATGVGGTGPSSAAMQRDNANDGLAFRGGFSDGALDLTALLKKAFVDTNARFYQYQQRKVAYTHTHKLAPSAAPLLVLTRFPRAAWGGGTLRQRIPDTCGATAVATFIYGKDVYVCWAGDSEAALFSRDGSERHLCVVHKASLDVRAPCALASPPPPPGALTRLWNVGRAWRA